MKILKSKKALSPVVASIILIAVTVAVSIAVAVWMGALPGLFMKIEEISFTGQEWGSNYINITMAIKSDVVFTGARVDDKITTCYRSNGTAITSSVTYSVAKGNSVTLKVMNVNSVDWAADLPYKITIVTQNTQYPWIGNANP